MQIRNLFVFFVSVLLFLSISPVSFAQEKQDTQKEETLEAKVISVKTESKETEAGDFFQQEIKLNITKGSLGGKDISVKIESLNGVNQKEYKTGDRVLVGYVKDESGGEFFYVQDYIRTTSLLYLFLIFVLLAVLISGWQGITSLFGLAISFLVIFFFILPRISTGDNPIVIAILGSFLIIPITFYLSHGFNKKTTVAIFGTIISLILTGALASFFVEFSKLTGFASEEAAFLQNAKQGVVNIKGLLLAGIIIGALGILDDITVSQASIVNQLKQTNSKLKFGELYGKAMKVGKDHISSLVNTLVLVYTGAALPLLLLFVNSQKPFLEVINNEIIAEEIVRTLVASSGLILAIPITTFIASLVADFD